ncbi:quinolinate synthase NadA [Candidatus Margulisiibacteriota bacterium]
MSADILKRIQKLKKERNAVILAHNYQVPEVQDIADHLGDSLGLSIQASKTKADVIVFCGVHFMAETAAIICPDKKVIMPDVNSGCPMADMITPEDVKKLKKDHPGVPVVAYVNTSAAVKAETDYACTSANAVKLVNSMPNEEIIFIPDKFLGDYVRKQTGKKLHLFNGYCTVHVKILPEYIKAAKKKHPNAEVMVHPECPPGTVELADKVLSTSGMIKNAKGSKAQEFIVGTETGIIYRLKKENPGKKFYPATELAVCPNMKKNSLEKVLWSLEEMKIQVLVPEDIRIRARKSIDRMLEVV